MKVRKSLVDLNKKIPIDILVYTIPEYVAAYLFGSKARGDSTTESDIDVLVVTKKNDWLLADHIRRIGYDLDLEIDYKLSIIVIPEERFSFMKEHKYSPAENVLNEGVAVCDE